MDYEDVQALRRHHPAWHLLRADSAALVVSALFRVFVVFPLDLPPEGHPFRA